MKKSEFKTRKQAAVAAQSLLADWNDYLSSNVYGFRIEESGGSCWGFYGDYDAKGGALEVARESVEYYVAQEKKRRFQQLKVWIKHKVPLENRTPSAWAS